ANICDAEMIGALQAALDAYRDHAALRGVLLDAEGPHFSFGASVEEHLADRCAAMLASLHTLILALAGFRVPVLVAVRGQCLGGGLEIALAGGPIFATPGAQFGQPEIKLGVFAPAASCLLPWRMNAVAAEDLLWSGRSIDGVRAHALGLVHELAEDPVAAALAYFDEHLAPRSAAALAYAVQAVRAPRLAALRDDLARVERLYLEGLMRTHDANEGLAAFLAKRAATWEHR
ncbi:MAG: cyclohexa-1,5-dienecarbonyl-CoA hydratase, partial [Burkholderiales bacterium]|nr:cyclohexa-1,5-dienecarbonyl-CoA hydratase [Burkholderiales bacterium]